MTAFIGPALSAGASILGGILGSNAAAKGAKAGKKAAKVEKEQSLKYGQDVQGQYASDIATNADTLAQQKAALTQANTSQDRLLAAGGADIGGAYQPYMDYGTESLAANEGVTGRDPAATKRYIDAFLGSPDYLLNYGAAQKAGADATAAGFAAGPGTNNGAIALALQQKAVDIANPFINQYADRIQQGINTGLDATKSYTAAKDRLLGYGLDTAQNYAKGLIDTTGAYTQNVIGLGKDRLAGLGSSYGGVAQAAANKAAAIAGGATGQATAWNNALTGVTQAAGSLPPGYGGKPAPVYNFNPNGFTYNASGQPTV